MENELIKITTNEEGKKLVSSRELYEGLGYNISSGNFTHWIEQQLNNTLAIENEDYIKVVFKNELSKTGQTQTDYIITIDIAKEICMIVGALPRTNEETKKLSKQYRKYFIECEKRLKQAQQPQLPQTYLEALKSLVASEEERLRLEEEKKLLIEEKDQLQSTLNKFLSTKGLYDIGTFAKVLDIPKLDRTNIFKWFKSHNYLMSSNIPYQQYMRYFSVKEVNKNSMIFTKTLLKPEGVIYFYKKIAKEYNIDKTIEQVSEELKGDK